MVGEVKNLHVVNDGQEMKKSYLKNFLKVVRY